MPDVPADAELDDAHIYPEDVVSIISEAPPRRVGIICRVAGETYPDENDVEGEPIPEGYCAVCWIGRNAQQPDTIAVSELEVVDRCFLYGQ